MPSPSLLKGFYCVLFTQLKYNRGSLGVIVKPCLILTLAQFSKDHLRIQTVLLHSFAFHGFRHLCSENLQWETFTKKQFISAKLSVSHSESYNEILCSHTQTQQDVSRSFVHASCYLSVCHLVVSSVIRSVVRFRIYHNASADLENG